MPTGLFIDGGYIRKVFSDRINFLKLRTYLETLIRDSIEEAYYFDADTDPPKMEKMLNALAFPPPTGPGLRSKIYWLQKKELHWPPFLGGGKVTHQNGTVFELTTQKAVDVGLIFHLTRSYYRSKWTNLVLAAGDGDFHEPVQNLVENDGVKLWIVGSLSSISQDLRPYGTIVEIDKEPLHSSLIL